MGYDIKYIPRTTIKSQALADFVAEWIEVYTPTPDVTHEYWTCTSTGRLWDPSRSRRGADLA
jgi:hypothetical protein